jgi:hypothetical protein
VRRLIVVLSFSAVLIFAATAQAQVCAYGQAYMYSATGVWYYASNFHIKWCKADANLHPTTQCGSGTLTSGGLYNIDVTQYGPGYYFPYLWRDDIYWGSDSYPAAYAASLVSTPACNQFGGTLYSTPRTLPSNAVYPANNAVNVGTSFTLQWSDGLDADRRSTNWPVTYDIYASGNEYPENLVFSNIPCNGVGTCNISVSGLVYTTRYQWRVVGRIKSTGVVTWAGNDNTFYQSSATLKFATTWDPSVPLHNILTYNGNYLRAVGGGGGAVDAAGSSSNYETQFQILDLNGGTLYSGDQINIHTNRNYFLSAVNGGGYGVTTMAWNYGYETWTIVRLAGFGPINSGDQVAFLSYGGTYYMTAEGGGGGAVNANRTAVGPWETFTFQ